MLPDGSLLLAPVGDGAGEIDIFSRVKPRQTLEFPGEIESIGRVTISGGLVFLPVRESAEEPSRDGLMVLGTGPGGVFEISGVLARGCPVDARTTRIAQTALRLRGCFGARRLGDWRSSRRLRTLRQMGGRERRGCCRVEFFVPQRSDM